MAVASVASDAATEVLMPGSEDEAIAAFGDGAEVVVVGGGTIVVPDLTYRRLRPAKALMLGNAGLSGIETDGSRVTIGATTPVQALVDMSAPLGPCAANVADLEIRSQGTVGGNLCAGEGRRGASRRPPGRVPRARRDGPLGRERRRHRGAARGLPRQARRAPSPERELRRAGRRRVRRPRPPTHARLHGTRGLGCTSSTTGHSASPRPERARGGLAFRRPRLRPEIPLRQAKRR